MEQEIKEQNNLTIQTPEQTPDSTIKYSYSLKESYEEEGEFYSEGFIATTHPDRAAENGFEGDILSKEAIQQIADFINANVATINNIGATRIVSNRHDWIKEQDPNLPPAGIIVPQEDSQYAIVKEMDGGHYGVYVKVHHNKNHPQYENIIYEVKNGYLPGYSIEFVAGEYQKISFKGKAYRLLKSIKDYVGHAFAHARLIANPSALITSFGYKEIVESKEEQVEIKNTEVKSMDYEKLKKKKEAGEELSEEEQAFLAEQEKSSKEIGQEQSSAELSEVEEKEIKNQEKEVKIDAKEIVAQVKESPEFKQLLDELKPEAKVLQNKETNKGEKMQISIKEMIAAHNKGDVFEAKEIGSELLYGSAAVKETLQSLSKVGTGTKLSVGYNLNVKCVGKGLKISGVQTKDTLVTGDNPSSYTQADVEFADVFAPGIIDTFNNQTNLFGFLKKEQHVGGEHYQWKMVTNKDPNSVSTFVDKNAISVVKNFSSKDNYQTALKIARRGVGVSDFVNRYSARSLGDLFQMELDLQMKEMMNDVNAALFAEVTDTAGDAPLGLEAVADSAGNTSMYGKTRSVANRLAPGAAADTYLAVGGALTEAALRAKIDQLLIEGSNEEDIAIVAHPRTYTFLLNLLDGNRRYNTVETQFGFNKKLVATYDGFPIIRDHSCNNDAIYVIDSGNQGAVIVVGMEPRIVELGKTGAAMEAYVQMDFAFVYKQPRRIGMLDTLTS